MTMTAVNIHNILHFSISKKIFKKIELDKTKTAVFQNRFSVSP